MQRAEGQCYSPGMRPLVLFLALPLLLPSAASTAQSAKYIDPLLGADGGGNVFVGPALPYGMAKPGPDTGNNASNAGWTSSGVLNGFSQTHVSGTGGAAKYGNVLVQPTVGSMEATDFSSPRRDERASAGYYAVTLDRFNVGTEITAARRTSVYRFTYPASDRSNLVFDVGHVLGSPKGGGQVVTASHANVLSPTEVVGSTSVIRGWNHQSVPYTVYFYALTDTPATSFGIWQDAIVRAGEKEENYTAPFPIEKPPSIGLPVSNGAYLSFATKEKQTVMLKIGISFVSIDQARRNALEEVPAFDFERTHREAAAAWDKAIAPIQLSGADDAELTKFSTAIYHTLLMPVDRAGENPLWMSNEPYYDDFYTLWDTFRSSNPLITLIDQKREVDIVRSLIETQQKEGFLPDGRSGNFTGTTQGGSNAEMVLADAYVKHLPSIDWGKAYAAVVKDAEVEPKDYIFEGRGDLEEWKQLGYLSIEGSGHAGPDRPGSRTMEYAANDYAIALMARGLKHPEDEKKYLARAAQWKNLWDRDAVDSTEGGYVKGFIWPRHRDGSWKTPFDSHLSGTWNQDNFYEGTTWTYSLYVPQDVRNLMALVGGKDALVRRLDLFFARGVSQGRNNRYDVGNEPGFLSPYLYNWAGAQSHTAFQVRAILAQSFKTGTRGIPGNDDSGAMSSFLVFNKLGIFPVAGQTTYLIGSPFFPRATLHLANGKTFTIVAKNVSETNLYIASARWNGVPYTRSWFTHDELMKGGTLTLEMTDKPTAWDTGLPPPSMSDPAPPSLL
jgi:predicted alpha-1,2-mannosidase